MRILIKTFLLCAVLVLSACGEPTIDASSSKALDHSMQQVAEPLSPEQRAQFKHAVMSITMHKATAGVLQAMSQKGADVKDIHKKMFADLDGKTAAEVIAYAKALNAKK